MRRSKADLTEIHRNVVVDYPDESPEDCISSLLPVLLSLEYQNKGRIKAVQAVYRQREVNLNPCLEDKADLRYA